MNIVRNLGKDKLACICLSWLALVMLAGLFAPWISPHAPDAVDMSLRYAPPSWAYPLGNDHLGRCVLSRLIYGIRPSLLGVLVALGISLGIGTLAGLAAGYFKGRIDSAIMRACDVMLSFPGYVTTLAVVGLLGPGLENILLAFVISKWAWFARVIRTSVMQHSEAGYVKFAKAAGIGHFRILRKHMLPMTLADIAVIASSSMCSMILQVSGLSFLGLGVQAPTAEWGMMLGEARDVMFSKPELMLAPGLAIILVVCAFNFAADGLQAALDPKLASARQGKGVKKERATYEYVGS